MCMLDSLSRQTHAALIEMVVRTTLSNESATKGVDKRTGGGEFKLGGLTQGELPAQPMLTMSGYCLA